MSIDDDLYLLQSVASLAPLGNSALRVLAIGAEMRNIAHDKALFVAGEAADAAFVVQSGTFIVRPEGSEDFVAGPGTLFGLNALLVEKPRSATVIALQDSVVMRISRNLFQKVLESHPEAAIGLRNDLAARSTDIARDIIAVRRKLS
jgi:CRP-like cAMP-binding protein